METSGWAFMLTSVIGVTGLTIWCFYRVLTLPPHEEQDLHGPLDIETNEEP